MLSRFVVDGVIIGGFLLGMLGSLCLARGILAFAVAYTDSRSPYWALMLFVVMGLLVLQFVSFLSVPSAARTVLHPETVSLNPLAWVCVGAPVGMGFAAIFARERVLLPHVVNLFSIFAIFAGTLLVGDLLVPYAIGRPTDWGEAWLLVALLALVVIVVPSLEHWSARLPIRDILVLGLLLNMLGIFVCGELPALLVLLGITVV